MTTSSKEFMREFHWLMDMLHNIDVGLVVLDEHMHVKLWNSFMQNHSSRAAADVLEKNIFSLFPELPEAWFKRKLESVTVLQNTAFTTWEQRPYLFRFKNYRPVTGSAAFMYQNCTMLPLTDAQGKVNHICLIIYDVTEVAVNRMQLEHANASLHLVSQTDGLTGLLNRKTWQQRLEHEFKRFQRYNRESSLLMLDIDHFKSINDTHGHLVGDEVIRETAKLLKANIRDIDVAGRYGGEEFAIILVDTPVDGAAHVAERVRKSIEQTRVIYEGAEVRFTISLGIAGLSNKVHSTTMWIDNADRGLYRAKHGGRNMSFVLDD